MTAARWHVLDNGVEAEPDGTLLCVHGNPTWSYLWRRLPRRGAARLAGRRGRPARHGLVRAAGAAAALADRVDDLGRLDRGARHHGPVVTVAHDWGGPISLGWALEHRDQLRRRRADQHRGAPAAGSPASGADPAGPHARRCAQLVCVRTPTFVRGAAALSRPAAAGGRPRRAARRPYADRRPAPGDRRLRRRHPARRRPPEPAGAGRDRRRAYRLLDVPVLLLWGPRDPVFADRYLRDLRDRLPQADVHRYRGRLAPASPRTRPARRRRRLAAGSAALDARRSPSERRPRRRHRPAGRARGGTGARLPTRRRPAPAVVELPATAAVRPTSLRRAGPSGSRDLAGRAWPPPASGRATGSRCWCRPASDLTTAVYACWRVGAVDRRRRRRARAARPGRRPAQRRSGPRDRHPGKASLPRRALRRAGPADPGWPAPGLLGQRRAARAPRRTCSPQPAEPGAPTPADASHQPARCPSVDDRGAVFFTSGATGPAKGVRLPAPAAAGPAATLVREPLPGHARRPAGGGLRAVRALRPGPGHRGRRARHGRHPPATLTAAALADAAAAVDATRGLRLAGRAAQRGRDRRRADRGPARGAGPGPAADVGRRARARGAAAAGPGAAAAAPSCTRRTG